MGLKFKSIKKTLPDSLRESIAAYLRQNYEDYAQMAEYRLPEEKKPRPSRCMREMAAPCMAAASLEDMLRQADAGFTETLLKRIDETGKKDSEIYKKANISKQHFSKIRNNPAYKPTKSTALALAIALELDLEGTKDLIGRAGYALTNSSKFDLIIRYFIENRNYDIVQINLALYEFDQSLLGA